MKPYLLIATSLPSMPQRPGFRKTTRKALQSSMTFWSELVAAASLFAMKLITLGRYWTPHAER
jgi:hypothetical protein